LRNLGKVYKRGQQEVSALTDISVELGQGSFWAVMGPSGSGKSTLMNILGCLDRPTSGTYLLKGRDIGDLDDDILSDLRLKYLGFIFQSFNLIPQLTVEENIQLPLFYLGWESDRRIERAQELAASLDLGHRLDHRPAELSGGQQQRVAIARALANDPSIILADEPTGNVDSRMGMEIMGIISSLNEGGKTVIMVTHEHDIAEYASQKLYMNDGAIERIEGS
jgi:putative ABC transport system ATP-binding protein